MLDHQRPEILEVSHADFLPLLLTSLYDFTQLVGDEVYRMACDEGTSIAYLPWTRVKLYDLLLQDVENVSNWNIAFHCSYHEDVEYLTDCLVACRILAQQGIAYQ